MKTILFMGGLLLGAGAFAQQTAGQTTLVQFVGAGTVSNEYTAGYLTTTSTVARGASAHYSAGQSITLAPGFVARAGSVFTATLHGASDGATPEAGTTLTAYPNPFATTTIIRYQLPVATRATHRLTDAAGRLIDQTDGGLPEAGGTQQRTLLLHHLPAGVYLYQLQTDTRIQTLRLVKQ